MASMRLRESDNSDAASTGASAAVVSNPTSATNSPSALALLQVQDTLTSLHELATSYRRLISPMVGAKGTGCA